MFRHRLVFADFLVSVYLFIKHEEGSASMPEEAGPAVGTASATTEPAPKKRKLSKSAKKAARSAGKVVSAVEWSDDTRKQGHAELAVSHRRTCHGRSPQHNMLIDPCC